MENEARNWEASRELIIVFYSSCSELDKNWTQIGQKQDKKILFLMLAVYIFTLSTRYIFNRCIFVSNFMSHCFNEKINHNKNQYINSKYKYFGSCDMNMLLKTSCCIH